MKNKTTRIDPDPFTIVVGIAGIVGGLAGGVNLYSRFFPASPISSHKRAKLFLKQAQADLQEMQEHSDAIDHLVADAVHVDIRPTWAAPGILMVPSQFREYSRRADRVMVLLRRLLKSTHAIEKAVRILPYVPPESVGGMVEFELKIKEVLASRHQDLRASLTGARELVQQAMGLSRDLLNKLERPNEEL